MNWIDNVKQNIFPLSIEKYSLDIALEEWYFDHMEDNIEADSTCQLCDHFPIRYKFLITNHVTKKQLYVGSECILRFEDENYSLKDENGNFVDNDTLKNAKNTALKNMLLDYLKTVDSLDPSVILDIIEKDKKLSPKMIPMFYRPYKYADDSMQKIMRKYLNVNLRKHANQKQLYDFIDDNAWQAEFIREFMTPQQIEKYF